jgi:ATPase subunit of ABC transporter with duplicated ATPase domains
VEPNIIKNIIAISSMPSSDTIAQAQLISLDDTDCYASVWDDILKQQQENKSSSKGSTLWGGRGKGGRGLARRTIQPKDIVVEDVRLQYLLGDACLEGATVKLLQRHVYALVGKNGCGKSTLLQRMHAQKIPGWSTQWSSLYLPPELPSSCLSKSPLEVILQYHDEVHLHSTTATQSRIDELETKLEALNVEEEQEEMEALCEELSNLEEQQSQFDQSSAVEQQAQDALVEFEIDDRTTEAITCAELSRGQQKRVLLSVARVLWSYTNLLLLDEPTNHLDVFGLIQLRRLIDESVSTSTVVLVSHDVDLINDVATDIIDMQSQQLLYYPGNYDSYRLMKEQQGMHELRQSAAKEKKRGQLLGTLQHLKEKPGRGGAKKKGKAIASHRKKLEKHESMEKASSSATTAVSSVLPTIKKGLTAAQRLKLAESMSATPDKAVQFV